MAAILQTTFLNSFSCKHVVFYFKPRLKNKPTVVQIMAWRQTGAKPLSEPLLAKLTDAYMRHSAEMSQRLHFNDKYAWMHMAGVRTLISECCPTEASPVLCNLFDEVSQCMIVFWQAIITYMEVLVNDLRHHTDCWDKILLHESHIIITIT